MKPKLTDDEIYSLNNLLERAIENGQLFIAIQTRELNGGHPDCPDMKMVWTNEISFSVDSQDGPMIILKRQGLNYIWKASRPDRASGMRKTAA